MIAHLSNGATTGHMGQPKSRRRLALLLHAVTEGALGLMPLGAPDPVQIAVARLVHLSKDITRQASACHLAASILCTRCNLHDIQSTRSRRPNK
jgi:hypothetical protein